MSAITKERKEKFIETLKQTQNVGQALETSGLKQRTAFYHKSNDRDFRIKWEQAINGKGRYDKNFENILLAQTNAETLFDEIPSEQFQTKVADIYFNLSIKWEEEILRLGEQLGVDSDILERIKNHGQTDAETNAELKALQQSN